MHRPLFKIKILIIVELACLMMLTVQIWVSISPLNQIAVLLPRTCSKINVIQIITFVDTVWNHLNNININFCKHKIIYSMGLSSAQRLCSTYWKPKNPCPPPPRRQKTTDSRLAHTTVGWTSGSACPVGWKPLCIVWRAHTHMPGGPITALSPASVRSTGVSRSTLEI